MQLVIQVFGFSYMYIDLSLFFMQECCLCILRGGALKPTSNPAGQWAHVVCAVTIPDVTFGSPDRKEPVIVSSLTRSRQRLVRHQTCIHTVHSTFLILSSFLTQRCSFCADSTISDHNGQGRGVCPVCLAQVSLHPPCDVCPLSGTGSSTAGGKVWVHLWKACLRGLYA